MATISRRFTLLAAKEGAKAHALEQQQANLDELKLRRKNTSHHIQIKDLPPEQRINQLRAGRKHFIDTIKLIAHRGETVLVHLAGETLRRHDDARSFRPH